MRTILLCFLAAVSAHGAESFLPNYSFAPVSNALPWQMVGYRWQQDHPTSATVTNNLNMVTLGADNTGVTPVDTIFASAKSSVARGHAIYFPAGTYLFTNSILINASESLVIRGAGMGQTIIKSTATQSAPGNSAIRFEGGFGATTLLTADAVRGATNISVTSTNGFAPGVRLFIAEDIDSSKIDGNWEHPSARLLHQWNMVHSISSGTVTLVKPLYRGYETANGALLNRYSMMTNVGVEDLTIFQTSDSVAAGRTLLFFKCADYWASNVEVTNAGIHAIVSDFSMCGTIRNCYVHDAQTNQQSAYAFQVTDNSGEILVENNIAEWHSSGFLIQYGSGCVFGYNYAPGGSTYNVYPVTTVKFGIITHGDAAEFNLFEGNIASRAAADNFWGGNYYTTWFRNWTRGYQLDQTGSQVPFNRYSHHIDETNYYHSVVGHVIGHSTTNSIWPLLLASDEESGSVVWPGDDPQVELTAFLHGNYDLTSQAHTMSNGYPFTLDDSYYLAAKPTWYGNLPWPSIGSDIEGMTNSVTLTNTFNWIPAQARYYNVDYQSGPTIVTNNASGARVSGFRNLAMAVVPVTPHNHPASPLLFENFEGSGYATVGWAEYISGTGNSINEDNTTNVLSGPQSLAIVGISDDPSCITNSFAASSEVFGYFEFQCLKYPSEDGDAYRQIMRLETEDGTTLFHILMFNTGTLYIQTGGSSDVAGSPEASPLVLGQTYHVWWSWNKNNGSNSEATIAYSTTKVKPTSGDTFVLITGNTITEDATRIMVGYDNTSSELDATLGGLFNGAPSWIYDYVILDDVEIPSYP